MRKYKVVYVERLPHIDPDTYVGERRVIQTGEVIAAENLGEAARQARANYAAPEGYFAHAERLNEGRE